MTTGLVVVSALLLFVFSVPRRACWARRGTTLAARVSATSTQKKKELLVLSVPSRACWARRGTTLGARVSATIMHGKRD